jgi:hypothetical protein
MDHGPVEAAKPSAEVVLTLLVLSAPLALFGPVPVGKNA